MNLHRFESRTGISPSNFIPVPSCEIRTAYASAGLLASEVFFGSFGTQKNRHKHPKKRNFQSKKVNI